MGPPAGVARGRPWTPDRVTLTRATTQNTSPSLSPCPALAERTVQSGGTAVRPTDDRAERDAVGEGMAKRDASPEDGQQELCCQMSEDLWEVRVGEAGVGARAPQVVWTGQAKVLRPEASPLLSIAQTTPALPPHFRDAQVPCASGLLHALPSCRDRSHKSAGSLPFCLLLWTEKSAS